MYEVRINCDASKPYKKDKEEEKKYQEEKRVRASSIQIIKRRKNIETKNRKMASK